MGTMSTLDPSTGHVRWRTEEGWRWNIEPQAGSRRSCPVSRLRTLPDPDYPRNVAGGYSCTPK